MRETYLLRLFLYIWPPYIGYNHPLPLVLYTVSMVRAGVYISRSYIERLTSSPHMRVLACISNASLGRDRCLPNAATWLDFMGLSS